MEEEKGKEKKIERNEKFNLFEFLFRTDILLLYVIDPANSIDSHQNSSYRSGKIYRRRWLFHPQPVAELPETHP